MFCIYLLLVINQLGPYIKQATCGVASFISLFLLIIQSYFTRQLDKPK